MRSASLGFAAAILVFGSPLAFCGPSLAKSGIKPAAHAAAEAARDRKEDGAEDEQRETQNLIDMRARAQRSHSDSSGRVRPDLFEKAIAHMDRMGVADEIGGSPKK